MKDTEILKRLRGIRSFRENRAEAELGRRRRQTRKAEELVDEQVERRLNHLAETEAVERRRLQTITGTIVDASSLRELESQRDTAARKALHLAGEERNARADLRNSLERLGEAQNHYKRHRASGLKLEELIKRDSRKIGAADDNEEWPS